MSELEQTHPGQTASSTFYTLPVELTKIGRYEIVEEIGRGSMGTVYGADDLFTSRRVAIKVAHPHNTHHGKDSARMRKLFFNEAHAASILDHPNILSLYDADVEGDYCYLVMEYVAHARTLEAFCKPDTLLPMREVVRIIYNSAKALDYAHRKGIIHRDIKPSNILYTIDNDIRISDFSIAMINRKDNKSTQVEGFLGSPLYMSPEQINEWDINSNTDIFSLGVVMYEMLSGHNPFKAESLLNIQKKITEEQPAPITDYRPDLPDGLNYILKRMLMKKPDKRYKSGLDLAADLGLMFEELDKVESEDTLRKKFSALESTGFFKGFVDADLWELVRASNWERYAAGSTIIREGDLDNSFYVLLSGSVEIEKSGHHIGNLQQGDCFGEMGYLSQTKRSATVRAKSDVALIRVNATTLDKAEEGAQLRFLKAFVRAVISRLEQTTSILANLKQV